MKKLLLAIMAISVLVACKSKQKKDGDGKLTVEDFRQLFTDTTLSYKLTPETLQGKTPDSLAIAPELLQQFLTDTLAKADFPKGAKLTFFPMAYISGEAVDYFVVKAVGKPATAAYLCFTDKKGRYLDRVLVARVNGNAQDRQFFSIDSRNIIKITSEEPLSPGRTSTREDFYTVAADGKMTLIMTNSTGPAAGNQIFNPLDTLSHKHKYSADYTSGEMSIVSIRDGDDAKSFQFFISFSKENSGCKGELSGTGHFTGPNKGEFKDKETDCGISFQFSSSRVSIKEIGGCGAYRGVRCFFEGNYAKKK